MLLDVPSKVSSLMEVAELESKSRERWIPINSRNKNQSMAAMGKNTISEGYSITRTLNLQMARRKTEV